MSWPGGDDPSQDQDGRPTDIGSLGVFRKGHLVGFTREQTDRSLKLMSVPFDSLPQMPFFAPLFSYTTEWHKIQVARLLVDMSSNLGRLVTPQEADALAYHRSTFCSRVAWAPPAVLLTAAYFARRGRATFRFPFYTPKPASFNPSSFPSPSMSILKGTRAVGLWHLLRFGAYYMVCQFVVKSGVVSFAQTSFLINSVRDDRLKSLRDSLNGQRDQQRQQRGVGVPSRTSNVEATSSGDASTYEAPYQPYSGATGTRSESQPPPSSWPQRAPEPQGAPQDDDSFLFDDASPVAPSQRQQPQRPSASSSPSPGGGSAWDKLRQSAQQPSQNGQSYTQQRPEQYAYAPAEQEKAYAKEQAQKEFDAMLERERRGVGESGRQN